MRVALGLFVFDASSALFDTLERRRVWAHARVDRFGALAASQFTGPAQDSISLSGTLAPEVSGKYSNIKKLAEMADTGEAFPLVMRDEVWGFFTIESLDDRHSNLIDGGLARTIDFTLELMRVEEGEDA